MPPDVLLPPGNDLSAVASWALEVMRSLGLHGWRFQYNKRLTTTGLCRHFHRVIELSVHFVQRNPGPELLDALLHEVAHGLVGRGHGHDDIWKAKAVEVGARPERCGQADMPAGRWRAVCGGYGTTHDRHRRPRRTLFCRGCGWERGKLVWVHSGEVAETPGRLGG